MTPEENNITPEMEETVVETAETVAEEPKTASDDTATKEPVAQNDEPRGERNFSRDKKWWKGRWDRRDRNDRREKPKKEFDELMLEVRRVTRVTTWGRRMSFRATILVWNRKGKIGLGVAKWNDVAGAVSKATNEAYKAMFQVPITKGDTVPYPIELKYKSTRVRLLPASEGTGLKAGSSIRSVLELAGYSNMLSKMIGSNNKLNNALATIKALSSYKHAEYFSSLHEAKAEIVEKTEEKADSKAEIVETTEKKPVKKASVKKVDK